MILDWNNMLKPLFYKRDHTLNVFQAEWLRVDAARWSAVGGPDLARLSGTSEGRLDLARALGLLRCGVELVDESGQACWWGYVERVELWAGAVGAVCDLNAMTNRVRVSYTRLDFHAAAGGVKDTTAWINDLNSQAIYGVKEKVLRLQSSVSAQAGAMQVVELAKNAYPAAQPALAAGKSGPDVILVLKGWWHSLAWRTYSQTAGMVEHVVEKPGARGYGLSSFTDKVGQSFTAAMGGWQIKTVWIRCCQVGAPVDNITAAIYSDNAGVPGVSLVSMSLAGNTLPLKTAVWVAFTFPNPITATAGVYWLVFGRSGGYSAANYYKILVDTTTSYAGGRFLIYSTTLGWQLAGMPECDLMFRVAGGMETTKQIELMAAAGCGGQFLSGASIEAASGLFTNAFRSGDQTAQKEIEAQLQAGDVNGVRLLAEVTQQRLLRVFQAPAASTAVLHVDGAGHLVDENGAGLPLWAPAVGRWAVLDSPWLGSGGEYQQITDRIFLERVDYDAATEKLQPGRF